MNTILGIVQIAVAVFQLDLNSTNSIIVSILLFLGGTVILLSDTESAVLRTAHEVLSYVTFVIAVGLIVKVIFGF